MLQRRKHRCELFLALGARISVHRVQKPRRHERSRQRGALGLVDGLQPGSKFRVLAQEPLFALANPLFTERLRPRPQRPAVVAVDVRNDFFD